MEVITPGSAIRQPSDEKQRQNFRKKRILSTRFLDNFYDPDVKGLNQCWMPNGRYILKKKYTYAETGLCYNFEKGETLQKLIVTEKDSLRKDKVQNFLEYDMVTEENDILITIEYCSNCEDHSVHTQHESELFKNIALTLQKCILIRFPFIRVLLKPISTEICKESSHANSIVSKSKIIDEKYNDVRIGAMEIQMCKMVQGKKSINILHSKLKSGKWPSVSNVLNSIVLQMPMFNCELLLYDKEQGYEDSKQSEEDRELKKLIGSKFSNIEVKVYTLNNPLISQLSEEMKNGLNSHLDPKKRKIKILTDRKIQKESYYNSIQNRPSSPNLTQAKASRPQSFSLSANNKTLQIINRTSWKGNLMPEEKDPDIINTYKGIYIRNYYSDSNGLVKIKDLPYDTYLVVVEESHNFKISSLTLNFNQINKEKILRKYIGLNKHTNGYVQVHLYKKLIKENGDEEVIEIEKADLFFQISPEKIDSTFILDESETKVKIKETQVKGVYKEILVPGKYIIEASKKGFEEVRKHVEIVPGENEITIEMTEERNYTVKVIVYNYEDYHAIENAFIKLNINGDDVNYEGISNSSGYFIFDSKNIKEEFMSIYVSKPGYFPAQRTYVRSKGSEDEVEETKSKDGLNDKKEVVVILVKESYVNRNNCIVMTTYSNLPGENFEPFYLYSDNISSFIEINCSDSQPQNGVMTSYFKFCNFLFLIFRPTTIS
jgi:hypothetical protein